MNENASRPPTISVVVPVYCEAAILATALREIGAALEPLALAYEIIVIDDGSTDTTWKVIAQCAASERRLRAIRLSRRFGKEAAVCAGLELARGAATIVMDGDLQHPPAMIPPMVEAWRKGAEIVEAVKESRGDEGVVEVWRARLFYGLLRMLSGHDLDGASDFKLLSRPVLNAYLALKERNVFFRGRPTGWDSSECACPLPWHRGRPASVLMVGLGIIAEYIARICDEVKARAAPSSQNDA